VDYAFAFDSEFRSFFWSENPTNLGQAFSAALRVQEFLAAEKDNNSGNLACDEVVSDEGHDDDSCLDDHEPVITPLEPYAKFHEDEELSLQVGLLVPSSEDDKIQKEEQQINHAELNQQEALSLHIPAVVFGHEQFDEIPSQQGEQLLVQPDDDPPHSFPMILHSYFVLQIDFLTDHC
jgi:hypothetical protein